jgi:hypothetical protein
MFFQLKLPKQLNINWTTLRWLCNGRLKCDCQSRDQAGQDYPLHIRTLLALYSCLRAAGAKTGLWQCEVYCTQIQCLPCCYAENLGTARLLKYNAFFWTGSRDNHIFTFGYVQLEATFRTDKSAGVYGWF